MPRTYVRFLKDSEERTHHARSSDNRIQCWVVGDIVQDTISDTRRRYVHGGNAAESILRRYSRLGAQAFHEVDGFFVAALHDACSDALHLFGDFGGSSALYYARWGDEWLVSSNFRCLHEALPQRPAWNAHGLYEFLWVNYCLLDDTIDSRIKQVPAASVVTCRGLDVQITSHNLPDSFECLPAGEETVERLAKTLTGAVRRWSEGFSDHALLLTGGVDSRLILAALSHLDQRVTCYLHSADASVESRLAESAARLCGQPFHCFNARQAVIENFARYVNSIYVRAGVTELWNLGGMALREIVFDRHDVCYSGLGTSLTMKYAKAVGAHHMPQPQLAKTLGHHWGDPWRPISLFCDELQETLAGAVERRLLEQLQAFPEDLESHQLWDLHANAQRVPKWYPNGLRVSGRRIPYYAPLCDREFARLSLRLPWSLKERKNFATRLLIHYKPSLAHLPTTYVWPDRPLAVKLLSRLPRRVSPFAYDRARWWPKRQRLPFTSKPIDKWVHLALRPHLPAVCDFVDREMTLPLRRAAVASLFHRFDNGDLSCFGILASLIPLLVADGFRFDERPSSHA